MLVRDFRLSALLVAVFIAACGTGAAHHTEPDLSCDDVLSLFEAQRVETDATFSAGCIVDADCSRTFPRISCGEGEISACSDAVLASNVDAHDDELADFAAALCPRLKETCSGTMECSRLDYSNIGAFCREGRCDGFPD